MADHIVRHGGGKRVESQPTVEISADQLTGLLRSDGAEADAHNSVTRRIETITALEVPDPALTFAAGTTPPQFAHTLRREPAYPPVPSEPAAGPGERTDVATIAMRRCRPPTSATVAPPMRDDVQTAVAPSLHRRDDVRTSAELPSARRPHRTSANPLIRHPVMSMAPLSALDAPSSSSPPPIEATTAHGSERHAIASAPPDPRLAAAMAAAAEPTWESLLKSVREIEPTQEVALADVLHVETIANDRAPRVPEPAPARHEDAAAVPFEVARDDGSAPVPFEVDDAPPACIASTTADAPATPPAAREPAPASDPPRSALALAAALDDSDASTLLDAEVLVHPPPPTPSMLAIFTSESPRVALAATRSFELPALIVEPRDVACPEPKVILDAETAAAARAHVEALAAAAAAAAPSGIIQPAIQPAISARWMWPLDEDPGAAPSEPPTIASFPARELPPLDLLVGRMPGPPVGIHPTWTTQRITAPRHVLLPILALAAMIAVLYGIACVIF